MNCCVLALVAMNLLLGRNVESWDENYWTDQTPIYSNYDGYKNITWSPISIFTEDVSVENQMVDYDLDITEMVDVELMLKNNQTMQFLSNFVSEFERWVITQQLLSCPYISLCEFSLNLTFSRRKNCCEPCECNYPHCLITKTCCPDIIFKNKNNTTKNLSTLATKNCIPITFPTKMNRNVNVFGYNDCPNNGMQIFRDNCTMIYDTNVASMSDVVPVVHKGTLDLYRNRFCAYCHNLTDTDVEYLKVQVRCLEYDLSAESNILSAVFKQDSCGIEFKAEAELNYCSPAISECNATGKWNTYDGDIEKLCKMYRSPIENEHVFQNVFCSVCNGIPHEESLCLVTQISTVMDSDVISFMNVLFKVAKEASEQSNNCSEDQLYDRVTETCKDFFCSPLTSLQNGRCIEVGQDTSDVVYTSYLRLIPKRSLLIKEAYLVAEEVIQYIYHNIFDNMCGIQMVYQTDLFVANVSSMLVLNSKLLYYDIRLQLHYNNSQMTKSVVQQVLSLHKTVFTIQMPFLPEGKLEFSIVVKDDYLSIYEKSLNGKSDRYSDLSDTFVVLPLPLLLREYVTSNSADKQQFQARFLHLRRRYLLGTCPNDAIQLNVLHLDPCPKVEVSKLDIDWMVSDDGLVFELGNYHLDSHNFYFIDDLTIAMCTKMYEHFLHNVFATEANSGLSAEVIVSIVSLSCSILCLICTFITFCLFPNLRRSLPGKNNMSLVLVLMLAQITFLVASVGVLEEESIACKVVGILVHLLLLSSMFWMNICTYHMFQVLTKVQILSQSGSSKKFAFYHVYAILMAAIFVSINIVVSHVIFGNAGYGSNTCYISTQTMIIFTFCIPVIFVVLTNVGMFTYVVVTIKKMPSVQKNVQKERNDIVVFVKLSTITGATWIFGIINVWLNHFVLSYIFILLNAGQGVFIMFAFVVNRRVYNLYRELVLGVKVTSGTSHMSTKSSQI